MIRPAVPDDGPDLIRMGEAFFHEAGHGARFEFDRVSFAHTLAALGPAGLVLVVEHEGRVVGMAAADVARAFWNHNVLLGKEVFWYCDPDHRKGHGKALLKALEQAAIDRGAVAFDVVAEEGQRSEALARLYRAGGYIPCERSFRRELH